MISPMSFCIVFSNRSLFALLLLFGLHAFCQAPAVAAPSAPPSSPTAAFSGAHPAEGPLSAAAARSQAAQKEVGEQFSRGWGKKLQAGGTTALVQLLVSMFGAIFVFERIFNLRRNKIIPAGLGAKARQLWKDGDFEQLENLERTTPCTLSRAISWVARHRHASYGDVSMGVADIIAQEIEVHQQLAYPMGVVATLEPLLGLLGMILGMIQTFEVVALAGALGNPAQLAGGISEALITTGLGLALAIPFLSLFHFFKSRTNMFGSRLEKEMTGLLSDWFLSRGANDAH